MPNKQNSLKPGKGTLQTPDESICASDLEFLPDVLKVYLSQDSAVFVPLTDFPVLENASSQARQDWRLMGAGRGIHWETLDEDLSVAHLVRVYGVQRVTSQNN
jgi:hypothetical protein